VHSIVKDRDAANVDWEQALALQPGMADVHANIAVYKIEGGGRSESALETVWAARAADPTFGMAQNTRACVLAAKGRFADADRALVKADSLGEGQNPFVAYNAAELAPFVEATDQLQAIMLRQSKPGKFRGMPRLDSFSISIQPFGIGLEATIGFNERGGVYLTPELVEVKAEDEPARFITDYLLSYPRGLVKGSLQ